MKTYQIERKDGIIEEYESLTHRLVRFVNSNGEYCRYFYDNKGKKIREINSLGLIYEYVYSTDGKLLEYRQIEPLVS